MGVCFEKPPKINKVIKVSSSLNRPESMNNRTASNDIDSPSNHCKQPKETFHRYARMGRRYIQRFWYQKNERI